ncbi:VPS72 protein, partial [Nothoprocta ornata]|nr:VPS72 protein [Nothoprocta ornata]
QESGDDEYRGEQSESDDEVDSDFDIDEGDEPGSEADESEPRPRRRGLPRAYREPIKTLRSKKPDAPSGSQRARAPPSELQDEVVDSECRKHMRQSTTEHTRQTFLRLQERQVQSKRKKGGPNHERPLTQEELLEEAKITEEINLRSLGERRRRRRRRGGGPDPPVYALLAPAENYERLEADKKKQVHKKRKCVGPVIRYWSVTMPLVTELGKEENVDVEGLDQEAQQAEAPAAASGKCSRTFITFSDDETFERFFPKAKPPRVPVRELCPVTHKPAVYRDPVTDIPYSNIRAFKIIREAYKKYITAHGLPGAATAAAAVPPGADAAGRATRQKIIIKQSVPAT